MKYYTVNYPSDPEIKDYALSNYWFLQLTATWIEYGVHFNIWCNQLGI